MLFASLAAVACSGPAPDTAGVTRSETEGMTESQAWTTYQPLGGFVQAPFALSAAMNGAGAVGVAQVGTGNAVFVNFETNTDDLWTAPTPFGWTALGGYATSAPAMILDGAGRIVVFARGSEGHLWFKRETALGDPASLANVPWTNLGGALSATANIVPVIDANGLVEVFVLDAFGAVWECTQSGGFTSFGALQSVGGTLTGSPGVTNAGGQVYVFGRRADGAAWYTHGNSGAYAPWESLGGQISSTFSSVAAASWSGNGFDVPEVFVVGTGGQICWNPGPVANRWTCDTSGATVASSPTAIAWNNTVSVFALGHDQATWELDSNDSPYLPMLPWKSLGGTATGQPALAIAQRNTIGGLEEFPHLFVEGTDMQIYTKAWSPEPTPNSVAAPTNYMFEIAGVDVLSEVEVTGATPDTGYVDWAELGVQINDQNPDITAPCELGHTSPGGTLTLCQGGAGTEPFTIGAPLTRLETIHSFSDVATVALVLDNLEATVPNTIGTSLVMGISSAGDALQSVGGLVVVATAPSVVGAAVGGVIGAIGAAVSVVADLVGSSGGEFTATCAGGLVATHPVGPGNVNDDSDTLYMRFTGQELWDLTASGPANLSVPVSINDSNGLGCSSSHVLHLRISRDPSALGLAAQGKSGDLAVARIASESDAFDGWAGGAKRHESNGTPGLSEWVSTTAPLSGLTPRTAFAAVSRTPYNLDTFWIDGAGSVQTAAWRQLFSSFTEQTILEGPSILLPNSQLSAASRTPSTLDVFSMASDGNLWSGHSSDGATWTTLRIPSDGNGAAAGSVAALSRTPDTLDVFYVGKDGAVYDVTYSNNNWGAPVPVTGAQAAPAGGAVTATASTAADMEVFYVGNDDTVYDWTWTLANPTWIRNTVATGSLARPGAPISAVSRQPGMFDVALIGNDGLYELSCKSACEYLPFTATQIPLDVWATGYPESVSIVARTSWDLDIFFKSPSGQTYLTSLPDGATSWQFSGTGYP